MKNNKNGHHRKKFVKKVDIALWLADEIVQSVQ